MCNSIYHKKSESGEKKLNVGGFFKDQTSASKEY